MARKYPSGKTKGDLFHEENLRIKLLEDEVGRRVSAIGDLNVVTEKNIQLQIFILTSLLELYEDNKHFSKEEWGSAVDWQIEVEIIKGFLDIYNRVIVDGLRKWTNEKFIKKVFANIKADRDKEADNYKRIYYDSELKAIISIMVNELCYELSDSETPIKLNPALIDIVINHN